MYRNDEITNMLFQMINDMMIPKENLFISFRLLEVCIAHYFFRNIKFFQVNLSYNIFHKINIRIFFFLTIIFIVTYFWIFIVSLLYTLCNFKMNVFLWWKLAEFLVERKTFYRLWSFPFIFNKDKEKCTNVSSSE